MNLQKLRKIHRNTAIIFSPFLIVTSLTGFALLFRKDKIYGKPIKKLLIGLHNWELAMNYVGAILSAGTLLITITGIYLFIKTRKS